MTQKAVELLQVINFSEQAIVPVFKITSPPLQDTDQFVKTVNNEVEIGDELTLTEDYLG